MVNFLALAGGLAVLVLASQGKLDGFIHAIVTANPKAAK